MRKWLLAGAILGVVVTGTAQAQVQGPGLYVSGFGQYIIQSDPNYRVGILAPSRTRNGDGFGGGLTVGYAFEGGWDVGGGVRFASIAAGAPVTVFNGRDKAYYVAADLNVGYTFVLDGSVAVRPAIGARYVTWKHSYQENIASMSERFDGIGPRATIDAAYRFGGSWLIIVGVGGGPLFGNIDSTTSAAFPAPNGSRTVWNLDGQFGFGYDFGLVNVVLGWRGEQWWNLHSRQFGNAGGKEDRFTHGPFVRVSYNWGAPPPGLAPAPTPGPTGAKSFIVFFDFDRANLTATAVQTIKQAANEAKSGRVARITVTGHADRSGTDAYNMALSLRRANAVKDQLVREGIPAAGIAVIGRGESQPLVPTADGVREPQNRRVEIVLG
jgi:outer membrane protein OmpA-like peptidoglycan-associated protein